MTKTKELTAKEEAFCVAYTTIGSETFSNGAKSAEEAGYAEDSARTQAWRMLRKEHIKKRIRELYDKNMEENMVTVGSVLANLAHDRQMARKHNQYSVARNCTELEGKYLAMFTENINQTTEEPVLKLSEEERVIYREAAHKICELRAKGHKSEYGETPEERRQEIAERNVG
jgi:phage terminase small subunit